MLCKHIFNSASINIYSKFYYFYFKLHLVKKILKLQLNGWVFLIIIIQYLTKN